MAKAELGTKRQCPKCGTRFYDLGKDDPIVCVSCSQKFEAEQILKPRNRPAPSAPKPVEKAKPKVAESDDADDILGDDDDDEDDADLGTVLEIDDDDDDDIGVKIDPDAVKDEPS